MEEQSPEVEAFTQALNNKLQEVQDIWPFIKAATKQAVNLTAETACNKML